MSIWVGVLWGMLIMGIIGVVISFFCCMERVFNYQVIATGAALCMIYYSMFAGRIRFLLCATLIGAILCLAMIWCRPIRRHKKRVVRTRIKKSIIGIGNIAAICMGIFIIMTLPFTMKITGNDSDSKKSHVVTENASEEYESVYGDEYGFSANAEKMVNLQEEKWRKLSFDQKKELAQCVAHCEARYFGLWTPLNVEVAEFQEETVLGCYAEQNFTIYIREEHLRNGKAADVLETILHESYHAYSHRLVDLYESSDDKMKELLVFYETQQYAEEFDNYVRGSEDMIEYIMQQCEQDARSYAKQAVIDYYALIEEYLERNNSLG